MNNSNDSGNSISVKPSRAAMFTKLGNIYLWSTISKNIGKAVLRRLGLEKVEPDTRKEAAEWCSKTAINAKEALEILDLPDILIDPREKYGDIFSEAENKQESHEIPFSNMRLGGAADLRLLYSLIVHSKSKNIIETGVALGWSSLAILLALKEQGDGELVSVDMPYLTLKAKEDWVGIVVPMELKSQWKLNRMPDKYGLPKAIKNFSKIDFVHYDSDKTYKGRLWAYDLIWKNLRSGGILMSDDVSDNLAWKEFCEKQDIKPLIVGFGTKYVGLARK